MHIQLGIQTKSAPFSYVLYVYCFLDVSLGGNEAFFLDLSVSRNGQNLMSMLPTKGLRRSLDVSYWMYWFVLYYITNENTS